MMTMTFHESYGSLPSKLLTAYRKYNVSPADHDTILAHFDKTWLDTDIDWPSVLEFVESHSVDGIFRISRYA
jgi:hypothetical protein